MGDGEARMIDNDVLGICKSLREINRALFIVVHERPDGKNFIVMERCQDGVDRLVKRYAQLDGRVVRDMQYIQGVPLDKRMDALVEENEKYEAEEKEKQLDELYERMGGPMWHQLERDGFIDSRGVSAPKRRKNG